MISARPVTRRLRAAALVTVAALGLSACVTEREKVARREDNLAAAGFMVVPANTPERQAQLKRLPPHRFLTRVRGDAVTYAYADPLVCNCLYVGNQQAYDQYRFAAQQQHIANTRLIAAQMYSDAAWNWDAWGPWGPGYGFEAGLGW